MKTVPDGNMTFRLSPWTFAMSSRPQRAEAGWNPASEMLARPAPIKGIQKAPFMLGLKGIIRGRKRVPKVHFRTCNGGANHR